MGISDERKETMAAYNSSNKDRIYFQSAIWRDQLRLDMVEAYGGKCLHCGIDDPIVLTLDHINDDPEPEYEVCGKSSRGGYTLYRRLQLQGWPKDRFQLLCFNCNMRKEHKRRRDEMVGKYGDIPEFKPISRGEARAKAKANTNNTSGFKGVLWDHGRQRWIARFTKNGRLIAIGRFVDLADAAKAYNHRIRQEYGESAYTLSDEEIEQMIKPVVQTVAKNVEELGL